MQLFLLNNINLEVQIVKSRPFITIYTLNRMITGRSGLYPAPIFNVLASIKQ